MDYRQALVLLLNNGVSIRELADAAGETPIRLWGGLSEDVEPPRGWRDAFVRVVEAKVPGYGEDWAGLTNDGEPDGAVEQLLSGELDAEVALPYVAELIRVGNG